MEPSQIHLATKPKVNYRVIQIDRFHIKEHDRSKIQFGKICLYDIIHIFMYGTPEVAQINDNSTKLGPIMVLLQN